MLLIKNGHIKTMAGPELENGSVLIGEDGKIIAVGTDLTAPADAQVIDAEGRLVTPGCVEAHCHVGIHEANLRWEGNDVNEKSNPITPHMRAIDGISPQDEYLAVALTGGVTTACVGPGSANVVSGTFAAIKMYGSRIENMIVKDPVAMKCAFGENPKSAYGQSGKKAPITRMATASLLRELLAKSKQYAEDKEAGKNPKFDIKLEAMLPVMKGEIALKAHAHRADDILTAVRIAKEFGVKLTLDHCTDGKRIAKELAEEGFPVLLGPALTGRGKPELKDQGFDTGARLYEAGVKDMCIISDAPVTPLEHLPMYAGLAASEGLPVEEAWRAITINPATVMGIADRVGSLEPGKDGDVVIWTADPLTAVGGAAYITIVDGKVVYQA